jgi:hypothetical protein
LEDKINNNEVTKEPSRQELDRKLQRGRGNYPEFFSHDAEYGCVKGGFTVKSDKKRPTGWWHDLG